MSMQAVELIYPYYNFQISVKFFKNFLGLATAKPQKLFEKFASKSENFVTKWINSTACMAI